MMKATAPSCSPKILFLSRTNLLFSFFVFRDLTAFKSEIIVPEGRSKVQWVVAIRAIIPNNQLQIAWLNPLGDDISGQRQKYSMTIEENTKLNQVLIKETRFRSVSRLL